MLANEIVKSRHINISVLSLCVRARARPLIQRTSILLKAYIAYAIFKNIERIQAKL